MPLLVDYFVVCGVHSEELEKDAQSVLSSHLHPFTRSYTPRVLAHFPDTVSLNPFDEAAVRTLCMPDGLTFKKNLQDLHGTFHSFLITRENGTRAYGSVLLFYELVQDTKVQNMLESMQTKYRESRRPGTNIEEDSFFNRAEDKLYTSKCICFVTTKPIFKPMRAYLEQLYAVTTASDKSLILAELPLESYIYNILNEVPLPPPGKTVRFSGPLGRISWRLPSQAEFPLCDYSFREFFGLLGVRNVVKLLACILLEHQILLKSAEYERLMMCAQCSIALLFPFRWPHVFVPILPASQRGFLDAPVPFIMGLRVEPSSSDGSLRFLNIPNETSLCMVNIDQGSMTIPEELPGLPDIERLVLKVSEKVQEYSVECPDIQDLPSLPSSPESSTPTKHSIIEALRFVQEISSTGQGSDPKKLISELTSLNNPHIPNLINIAARAGIKTPLSEAAELAEIDEGMYEGTEEGTDDADEEGQIPEKKDQWDYAPNREEEEFANAIRDVCMSYFVENFANYENFIIMPRQSYDQWVRNREQFQNFDNTAFLSDQPSNHRPFYSAFLETSMFTAFIDQKIMTFWDPEQAGQELQLFDARVEAYRDKSGLAKPPTTPGSRTDSTSSDASDPAGEGVIEETAPLPHQLTKEGGAGSRVGKAGQSGLFAQLDTSLLQGKKPSEGFLPILEDVSKGRAISRPGSATGRGSIPGSPRLPFPRRHRNTGSGGSGFSSHSHAKFVNQLWRESRLRVKHMLGSTGESHNHIEENTHIAYLCDLLERIWGHGLKKRESKSPLWSHLMAYAETAGKEELLPPPNPSPLTYSRELTQSMSSLSMLSTSTTAGDESPRTQNLRAHFRRRKFQSPQLRARLEAILQPPSSTLFTDLLIVHNMRELKTDVGHARAWVRLSLEKKSLSRHLSQLLSNEELCSRRYREYAFLRTEEEREQFLYHLLTLTARDFNCFTTGFLNTTMTYRVLVVGEGKHFGLSTACLYVNLAGEFAETGVTEIPRGEYQIDITHPNLGPLTCLRIGHDNSGITPSLMVEMVLVHNLTTGQTHRFNCGRWFARAEDDGSVERFLVAERVPQAVIKSGTMSALLDVDSILPSPERRRKAAKRESEDKPVADIRRSLKSAVERIRTVCQGRNRDTTQQEMLQLVHGPEGFVKCMNLVLQLGFKCNRKFSKRLLVWDLFERVHEQLLSETPANSRGGEGISPRQMFLNAVTRINLCNPNIGKNEKATQLLCIGLRDHYLTNWMSLIAQNPVTQGLYEPTSFFFNIELLQFLLDTLALTHPLIIKLEPLLTQRL